MSSLSPAAPADSSSSTSTREVHYVLSTHWDREWYQPFQLYRYRLVQLMDRVLEGLSCGAMRGPFQTDGQSIILDDYLEVRPERRADIERLAREGKLVIGPWYVLPDEFLVSGESMIRNIALGRAMARAYGGVPSDAGFVCDLFGHVSQLPQMLRGFGVKGGYVWRGTNQIHTRHLLWVGADGTELPCYRFGQRGYCSYASAVRGASSFDEVATDEQLDERLKAYVEDEASKSVVEPLLLFDGGDHMEWDRAAYAVLSQRMDEPYEGYRIRHSSLDGYLDAMLAQVDRITERVEGELREPGKALMEEDEQWVIPGVASSRVWIKQANVRCQTLLTRWAEPLSALSHLLLGVDGDQGFLDVAWKWLLKNHPHDSIGGCSVDRVHEDMKFRFSQCEQIGDELTLRAMQRITSSVAGDQGEHQVRVGVFNPASRPVSGPVKFEIEVPVSWPRFNEFFFFEQKPAMRLYDGGGNEVPYVRLTQDMDCRRKRITTTAFPAERQVNVITVVADLEIPASGYTVLTAERGEEHHHTRYPMVPGLVTSDSSMENDLLSVKVESGGLLTLTDKRSGRIYERLLAFEDAADIGDGWYHGVPLNDRTYSSAAGSADVSVVANSPSYAAMRVRTQMHLPAEFDFKKMRRVEALETVVIDTLIELYKDSDHLKLTTTVDNRAKDHRLRVLMPTGCEAATTYLVDTAFDVVERDIALREDNHLYRELEIETKPQQSWTAVADGAGGLAVVGEGLLETAVRDQPERPIALTLLRSTRRTVLTDGEPEGQLQGPVTLRYCVVPLGTMMNRKRLFEISEELHGGHRVCTVMHDDRRHFLDGMPEPKLAASSGLIQVDGPAVLTSSRRVGEAFEVRLFNPEDSTVEAVLKLAADGGWTQAVPVNFEGKAIGDALFVDGGEIRLSLERKKIVTLYVS